MTMQTVADRPGTRLLKTKMFTEQLIVRRKKGGPPGAWEAPTTQSRPLDESINAWIDQTGNDLVSITAPNMFMQWMDTDRTMRLVVTAVMVTYVPALAIPEPVIADNNDAGPAANDWEPVVS